jgi:hypothetical protein
MLDRAHGCFIQTHHLPVPHVIIQHYLVPTEWQLIIYGEIRIEDRVPLCPTHHFHAHLAIEAAVNQICFNQPSIFDRRQFGRELWGWAEDAALWLKERMDDHSRSSWVLALPTRDGSELPPPPPPSDPPEATLVPEDPGSAVEPSSTASTTEQC